MRAKQGYGPNWGGRAAGRASASATAPGSGTWGGEGDYERFAMWQSRIPLRFGMLFRVHSRLPLNAASWARSVPSPAAGDWRGAGLRATGDTLGAQPSAGRGHAGPGKELAAVFRAVHTQPGAVRRVHRTHLHLPLLKEGEKKHKSWLGLNWGGQEKSILFWCCQLASARG